MSSDTDDCGNACVAAWEAIEAHQSHSAVHPYFHRGFVAGWHAAAEARADSAVPSSHVSETDQPKPVGRFRVSGGRVVEWEIDNAADERPDGTYELVIGESILREALARLVALEDLRVRLVHPGIYLLDYPRERERLRREFAAGIGPAWEAARSALAGMPK